MRCWCYAALLAFLAMPAAHAGSPRSGFDYLEAALTSADQQSYEALVVFDRGAGVRSAKLSHWREAGQQQEVLTLLDGPEQQLLRDGNRFICRVEPHNNTLLNAFLLRGPLRWPVERITQQTRQVYHFELAGRERIANQTALLIQARPVDELRFPQQFWVSEHSGLLLRHEIKTPRQVSSWMQVVSVEPVGLARQNFSFEQWDQARTLIPPKPPTGENRAESQWHAGWIPKGFAARQSARSGPPDSVWMESWSDGLADFSVWVVARPGQKPSAFKQGAQRVVRLPLDANHSAVVAGNLPASALTRIAKAIEYLPSQATGGLDD